MLGLRSRFFTSARLLLNFSENPFERVNLKFFLLAEGGTNFWYFSRKCWMVMVLSSVLLKVTLMGLLAMF